VRLGGIRSGSETRSYGTDETVKWILLFIAIALVWPLSVGLRLNPRERPKIFVVIGFLPFIVRFEHLYMAIDDWKDRLREWS
jgi:hypothetical protein